MITGVRDVYYNVEDMGRAVASRMPPPRAARPPTTPSPARKALA